MNGRGRNPFVYSAPPPVSPAYLESLKAWTHLADEAGVQWELCRDRWAHLAELRAWRDGSTPYSSIAWCNAAQVASSLVGTVTVTEPHHTALCNTCATPRWVSLAGSYRGRSTDCTTPERIAQVLAGKLSKDSRRSWERARPFENAMCDLKCDTCGRVTRHALVIERITDDAEKDNAQRTAALQKSAEIQRVVDDFRALGVRVYWCRSDLAASMRQYLDDNQWTLTVNPERAAEDVLDALGNLWEALLHERERQWFVTPADPGDPLSSPTRGIGFGRHG